MYSIDQYLEDMRTNHYWGGTYHTTYNPTYYTSGNHHVINCTHLFILNYYAKNHGNIQIKDQIEEYGIVKDFVISCWSIFRGILNRSPTKLELNGHDDYLAVRSLLVVEGAEIEAYSHRHKYYMDNTQSNTFNISCWHGRFPWLLAIYNTLPNLFYRMNYCLHLYFNTFNKNKKDTSDRILNLISIYKMNKTSKGVNYFIKHWLNSMDKLYPNGIGEMLNIYHNLDNYMHPMARIMYGQKFKDVV